MPKELGKVPELLAVEIESWEGVFAGGEGDYGGGKELQGFGQRLVRECYSCSQFCSLTSLNLVVF